MSIRRAHLISSIMHGDTVNGIEDLFKAKYVKRTGSPGNYKYWYRDPKTGGLQTGPVHRDSSEFESQKFYDKKTLAELKAVDMKTLSSSGQRVVQRAIARKEKGKEKAGQIDPKKLEQAKKDTAKVQQAMGEGKKQGDREKSVAKFDQAKKEMVGGEKKKKEVGKGLKVGEKVKMFEGEPELEVTKVIKWSDKSNTYDLKSEDGKIVRKNIPLNKIKGGG